MLSPYRHFWPIVHSMAKLADCEYRIKNPPSLLERKVMSDTRCMRLVAFQRLS